MRERKRRGEHDNGAKQKTGKRRGAKDNGDVLTERERETTEEE